MECYWEVALDLNKNSSQIWRTYRKAEIWELMEAQIIHV